MRYRRADLTYTEKTMQLRAARLCLDCEEIHEDQQCPVCSSEAFAYVTRWIPVEERRLRRFRTATRVRPEPSPLARWVERGVVGFVLVAASRWWWLANNRTDLATRAKVPPKNKV